ncbi:MAG: lytic murein transglycosylase [Alphaproteobacteria bacterium]|nr:MAG: lytic murein transglycosylase [Alphaproteobacteria bacterium]
MQKSTAILAAALLLGACATTGSAPQAPATNKQGVAFNTFYAKLRQEAKSRGHNPALLDDAFEGKPAPIVTVTKAEGSQPEIVRTFAEYTGSMLSTTRIGRGVEKFNAHTEDLAQTYARTGVSPSVVVALWGIETNYGRNQGSHRVVPALVTLAWQSPRADYFRKETFNALKVIEKTGKDPAELKGSWAGAMGQCQFMPSSYLSYATDGDGDGKADIWDNEADVLASASNYLRSRGWKPGLPWRIDAGDTRTTGVKLNSRGLSEPEALSFWKERGFKLPTGYQVSNSEKFRYYKPQTEGPAYLLGPNFSVILGWNNSSYFAWSALALSEAIEQQAKSE